MLDIGGQIPGLHKHHNILLSDRGSHPSALTARSGHEDPGCLSSGFRRWDSGSEMRDRGDRRIGLSSFIKGEEYQASPNMVVRDRGHANRHGWITHTRIDGDPAIRGHDLCFDKTCQRNRLAMCVGAGCKNGWNKLPSHGMMSHNEELSADRISVLLFSLRWYMEFILQSQTRSLCLESVFEYSEVEPTTQCRRQSTRRTHRH